MTSWLLRKSGSDSNGGTSATVRSTGTDGIVSTAGGTTKISSISATWGAGDVGHGIYASSSTILRLISAVQASQTATGVTASGLTTFTSAAAFNSTMLGCAVSGPGIAANTYISVYTSSSSMTLSAAAGAGFGSGTCTFGVLATTTGTTAFTSATGQTWNVGGALLTMARAMVTASGIHNCYSAGDSIYLGGGGTWAETVANTLSGSAIAPLSVIGDVDGAKTGDAGQVVLSAFTSGNTSAPSSTILMALAATTNISFSFITFVQGGAYAITSTAAAAAANYTFTDCTFNTMYFAGTIRTMNFLTLTTGLA